MSCCGEKEEAIYRRVSSAKELEQSAIHVKRIAIEDDSFVIEHTNPDKIVDEENPHDHIRFEITGNIDEDMTTLRKWANNNFYFIDNPQFMVDQLVNCVRVLYVDGAAKTINKIRSRVEQEQRNNKSKSKLISNSDSYKNIILL